MPHQEVRRRCARCSAPPRRSRSRPNTPSPGPIAASSSAAQVERAVVLGARRAAREDVGLALMPRERPARPAANTSPRWLVVAEHVEARARRRQQHGVARLRELARRCTTASSSDAQRVTPALGERLRDQRRIAADQQHRAGMLRARPARAARSPGPCRRRRRSGPPSCRARRARRRSRRRWCPWNRRSTRRRAARRRAARGAAGPGSCAARPRAAVEHAESHSRARRRRARWRRCAAPRIAQLVDAQDLHRALQTSLPPRRRSPSASCGASRPKVSDGLARQRHRQRSADRRGSAPARPRP